MSLLKVIALDGPSGVGKSSVARDLASKMDWTYLDTGALYRALSLAWLRAGGHASLLDDSTWLKDLDIRFERGATLLNGEDVSNQIREPSVTSKVSFVAAHAFVREKLTAIQRSCGQQGHMILDGRDIGTVVFPDAFLKVFLEASAEERARRRWLQTGKRESFENVLEALKVRDLQDENRALAPLKPADDAWKLSTDDLSQEEVVNAICEEAQRRL